MKAPSRCWRGKDKDPRHGAGDERSGGMRGRACAGAPKRPPRSASRAPAPRGPAA